ncbi:MAG: isoleucine--tRNA ligase [Candidatus Shikimatogenerans bostrichidophilus]|nr:MAG: isoleucine--tRNA ligase [Candidatus Shikimatogenerans bostrichidophilus]
MNKKLNLYKIYKEIFFFWKKNKIKKKKQKKNFVIYDGPPSLNGEPGIHHVFSRIIKDIVSRFYIMNNYNVINKIGWDTHGLPIEISVEKKLNISKNDIGKKITIEYYNNNCKNLIKKNLKKWIKFTNKIGYFFNKKNYYITSSKNYIESVWWIIKEIYKKKLLYKDYRVLPYSPMAGTSISYQELNFPNTKNNVIDLSVYVLFKIKNFFLKIKKKIYLLVWTTTPWTLPSNTALLVKKKIYYLLIKIKKKNLIIAEQSIKNIGIKKYKILYRFLGKKLINLKYKPLLNWFTPFDNKKKYIIIEDTNNIIKPKLGTGIIHISPTFGKEDFEIGKKNNLSNIFYKNKKNILKPIVDKNGKFIKEMPYGLGKKYIKTSYYKYKKKKVFSVDKKIIKILKKEKKIFKVKKYKHKYPHCWRTNQPIIYYPIKSWFINLIKIKKKIIKLSKKINWLSSNLIKNKFKYWLKNIKDWNISRSRFWGTPLPIWSTKNNKNFLIIGSLKELNKEINKSIKIGYMTTNPLIKGNKNLHKDLLDKIILSSNKGEKMYRERDIIDVWFDSGCSSYAQYHYPFNNKKLIKKKIIFPSNFISEGVDQIRGWFFTLHVISTIISNSNSYINVLPLGIILDKYGKKMSKSKGNTLCPNKILKKYGPDSIRWYLIYNKNSWKNIKFNIEDLEKISNNFFNTLYNIFLFFYNYSKIDNIKFKKKIKINKKIEIDTWILYKLNNLVFKTYNLYKHYKLTKVARKINNFVIKDLSNWYIRLSRKRFWKKEKDIYKKSAYNTLYICIITILKITYPISPFFMEYIYKKLLIFNINIKKSIKYNIYPKYNRKKNNILNKNMDYIRKCASIILFLRKKKNIKVRQPLNYIYIVNNKTNKYIKKSKNLLNLLKQEVNVKKIKFIKINLINKYIKKKIKINYKILGPKLKNKVNIISKLINELNQKDIENIEKKKYIYLNNIKLSIKNFNIYNENINKNIIMHSEKNLIIILDTKITKKLKKECCIRDFIRLIQIKRKELKLNLTDKIIIYYYNKNNNNFLKLIKKFKKKILIETLASKIIKINKKYKNYIKYKKHKIYYNIKKK